MLKHRALSFTSLSNKNSLQALALIAFAAWISHFFYFRAFGFYEDDYAFIVRPMGLEPSYLLVNLKNVFVSWPQGRPLEFFLPTLFSMLGARLGGLETIYIVGCGIVILNSFLCYILLEQTYSGSEIFALVGALTFCLFPADTTKSFLMHLFGLQPSLTFLLLASLCYLTGRTTLSYTLILGSLLTYESPFMVFLGIPLLKDRWDRRLARELARHIVILSGIVLCVVIIRKFMGDTRLEMSASIFTLLLKIWASMFIGPAVSVLSFFRAPVIAVFQWNMNTLLAVMVSWAVFVWGFHTLRTAPSREANCYPAAVDSKVFALGGNLGIRILRARIGKVFLAGIVMLSLAYLVSFTHYPPTATYGRLTSVHLAATFAGSIIFACIAAVIFSPANLRRLKNLAVVASAAYFSLLVGYHFLIQEDFKQSWQNQQSFWTGVVENCPDMTEGTVIFVLGDNLPTTKYILTNSWADPVILEQIYQFPAHWKNPPRLFVVSRDWTEQIVLDGDQFKWKVPEATWESHWEVLPSSNMIMLEMMNGKLTRNDQPIIIKGKALTPKVGVAATVTPWKKGVLFDYLIQE